MRYIPHTPEDREEMLAAVGVQSLEELFAPIPDSLRMKRELQLPEAMPECELNDHLLSLSQRNRPAPQVTSFAGAGIYRHFVPAAVDHLIQRSEFYTAYTPYQPEVSQGTLQSIFEFQTMIARLLGMEVSNASMYDGSSAMAESVLMLLRAFRHKRPHVVIAGAVHPEYLEVARTYLERPEEVLRLVPAGQDGRLDVGALKGALDETVAGVIVQYPNFFGLVEDVASARRLASEVGALMAVSFTEPVAFGLLKSPGELGADIVVGEGQSLGIPVSYGGPLLGLMACKKDYVRSIPGRLVGQTVDRHGNRCFVITLATREQHIRRAKATSNICTNEGLVALSSAIYMSMLGNQGLMRLARLNHQAATALRSALARVPGVSFPHAETPFFNEFVVELNRPAAEVLSQLAEQGIVGGVALSRFMPENQKQMLVTATELTRQAQIDALVQALTELLS